MRGDWKERALAVVGNPDGPIWKERALKVLRDHMNPGRPISDYEIVKPKPLGSSMIFKKGGRVKKTGVALVHKGEFVLPVGVKPTKAQLKKVAKKRK